MSVRRLAELVRNRAAAMILTDTTTQGFWDDVERILGREPDEEECAFLESYATDLGWRVKRARLRLRK